MTSRGHRSGLCCGGCSKSQAEVLGKEWVQELQCPDPSQLMSSFLGTAPGTQVRDNPPAWHQNPPGTAPAPSLPSAAPAPHCSFEALIPRTQHCCSQGPLKLGFWGCIWEINHSHSRHKDLYGLPQAVSHQTQHPGCLKPSKMLVQRNSLLNTVLGSRHSSGSLGLSSFSRTSSDSLPANNIPHFHGIII